VMFTGYEVQVHQSAATAVTDIQANFFRPLSHARSAITAKVKLRLIVDVCERDLIRSLPTAVRSAAERPQPAWAKVHLLEKTSRIERPHVFFIEHKPHDFWPAKKCVAS
jgi:hypothetical protein